MRRPSNVPAADRPWKCPPGVDPDSLPAILARNLWGLMAASQDLRSQLALGKKAGVGQATIDRILRCTPGVRLDSLSKIGKAFTPPLEAWVLLLPALDPANPPVASLTQVERDLLERLMKVSKQVVEHNEQGAGERDARPDRVSGSHRKGTTSSKN